MLKYTLLACDAVTGVPAVTQALKTALTTAGNDLLGVVSDVVPIVIPVLIGITAVGIGIKVFKRVTGR